MLSGADRCTLGETFLAGFAADRYIRYAAALDLIGRSMFFADRGIPFWVPPFAILFGLFLLGGGIREMWSEYNCGAEGRPLRNPTAIAYFDGQIFVFDDYRRVRIFDETGRQIDSWLVNTSLGAALLEPAAPGLIRIRSVRRSTFELRRANGDLVQTGPDHAVARDMRGPPYTAPAKLHNERYFLRGNAVYLRRANGETDEIVPGSFRFAFFPGPIAAAQGTLGILLGLALAAERHRRRAAA